MSKFLLVLLFLVSIVSQVFGTPKRCNEGCLVCGKMRDDRFVNVPNGEEERDELRRAFNLGRMDFENRHICSACHRALRRLKSSGTTDFNVIFLLFSLTINLRF